MGRITDITGPASSTADDDLARVLRAQLRQVVAIQHELLTRLLSDDGEVPLDFADAFEDAGNRMLDLSEMISRRWLESSGS